MVVLEEQEQQAIVHEADKAVVEVDRKIPERVVLVALAVLPEVEVVVEEVGRPLEGTAVMEALVKCVFTHSGTNMKYIVYEKITNVIDNVVEWDGISGWRPSAKFDVFASNAGNPGDSFNPATEEITPKPIIPINPQTTPFTVDELTSLLITKNVITQVEVDTKNAEEPVGIIASVINLFK